MFGLSSTGPKYRGPAARGEPRPALVSCGPSIAYGPSYVSACFPLLSVACGAFGVFCVSRLTSGAVSVPPGILCL